MGCRELIEALRKAGDDRIRDVRAKAEAEAERIRTDAAARIARARETNERKHALEAARRSASMLADAQAQARRISIKTDRLLAERLREAARSRLGTLRNVGYRGVFEAFARELPRAAWKTLRVNEQDLELGRELFPGAEVVADRTITGGLAAVSEHEHVRVVNTFEKRLDRLWEELLPEMVKEVREMLL